MLCKTSRIYRQSLLSLTIHIYFIDLIQFSFWKDSPQLEVYSVLQRYCHRGRQRVGLWLADVWKRHHRDRSWQTHVIPGLCKRSHAFRKVCKIVFLWICRKDYHYINNFLINTGTLGTRLMHQRSVNRTLPLSLCILLPTQMVRRWLGTLWGRTGRICSQSELYEQHILMKCPWLF